jgi:hypothetical protein
MWDMKCMILPVIIGVTGMVTKGIKKELEATPGIHPVDPQQTAMCVERDNKESTEM